MSSEAKRNNYICNLLGIKLEKYNIEISDNIDSYNNCAITACCELTGKSYSEVYKLLVDSMTCLGLLTTRNRYVVQNVLEKFGYGFVVTEEKLKLAETLIRLKKYDGKFGIILDSHILVYSGGTWYDNDYILEDADNYLTEDVAGIFCLEDKVDSYFQ